MLPNMQDITLTPVDFCPGVHASVTCCADIVGCCNILTLSNRWDLRCCIILKSVNMNSEATVDAVQSRDASFVAGLAQTACSSRPSAVAQAERTRNVNLKFYTCR